MPEGAGDRVINDQCGEPGWEGYRDRWLKAAAAYRVGSGDPWVVTAAEFTADEKSAMSKLYELRRRNGPIARIRNPPEGYPACPMCGSSGGRSLDHALPKSKFPEFSILRENLVPACRICNSDVKGAKFRGVRSPERYTHPYYDNWASDPIWQVDFGPDLDAVVFRAVPTMEVTAERRPTVQYHLSNVLGKEWQEHNRRYWGTLPGLIRNRVGANVTAEATRCELVGRLADEELEHGVNAWTPAFLRGAIENDRLPHHVANRARTLPQLSEASFGPSGRRGGADKPARRI